MGGVATIKSQVIPTTSEIDQIGSNTYLIQIRSRVREYQSNAEPPIDVKVVVVVGNCKLKVEAGAEMPGFHVIGTDLYFVRIGSEVR